MTRRTKKTDPSIHPDGKPLEIGEVVMLKSGGPKMTVARLADPNDGVFFGGQLPDHDPDVGCEWFTEGEWANGPRASNFHPKTLQRVVEPKA